MESRLNSDEGGITSSDCDSRTQPRSTSVVAALRQGEPDVDLVSTQPGQEPRPSDDRPDHAQSEAAKVAYLCLCHAALWKVFDTGSLLKFQSCYNRCFKSVPSYIILLALCIRSLGLRHSCSADAKRTLFLAISACTLAHFIM